MAPKTKTTTATFQFKTESIFAVTPKGKAQWCKYLEPDQFGYYSVDIYLNNEDTENFINILEDMRNSALEELQDAEKVIKSVADVFKEKDGKKYFQIKIKEDRQKEPITLYNVFGKEDKAFNELIGNGSTIKVKYMAKPYYMNSTKSVGVSLRLLAIQLIEHKEFKQGGNDFGDESSLVKPKKGDFASFDNEASEDTGDEF